MAEGMWVEKAPLTPAEAYAAMKAKKTADGTWVEKSI